MNFSKANIKTWSRLGACGAYGMAAMELPELDDKMIACTADLCFYSGLERFKRKYPDRLYNVGIAEQNLIGIAGGLANEGFNPFASTYASFAISRALDQVRVIMGYMQLPVKLIGLTSGYSVGILGATHMCIEDIAIMRSIPNITVICPADTTETVKAVLALANFNRPVYLRLTGPMNAAIVYKDDYNFQIGKAVCLREGDDIVIVATGTMVAQSLAVAELLKEDGINVAVINMHTIKPLDTEALDQCLNAKLLVTVEEHSKIGGLGSAISEYLADKTEAPKQIIIGIEDFYAHAADYKYLIAESGLDTKSIYDRIKKYWIQM